jgi:hypothetical protein
VGVDFQGNLMARPLEEEVAISNSSERSDKRGLVDHAKG